VKILQTTILAAAFLLTVLAFSFRPSDVGRNFGFAGYWLAVLGIVVASWSAPSGPPSDI
jgi:hypothetical protein